MTEQRHLPRPSHGESSTSALGHMCVSYHNFLPWHNLERLSFGIADLAHQLQTFSAENGK